MESQSTQAVSTTASPPAAAPSCATGFCPLASVAWRWRGTLLWVLVLGLAMMFAWPMLKGTYYRASGAATPQDNIPWRTDFAAALEESRQSGKPLLVDFTASWCPPCRVMKHDVWPKQDVRDALLAGYIPVLVDVDKPETGLVQRQYQVKSIPTILVVDADGNVLRGGAFMSQSQMVQFLNDRG